MKELNLEEMNPEEYQAWLEDPTTQKFRKALRKWQESLKDQWATGQFQNESAQSTAMMNVGAQAQVQIIRQILDMDWPEIENLLRQEEE